MVVILPQPQCVNHCGLMTYMWVIIGSGNGLVPPGNMNHSWNICWLNTIIDALRINESVQYWSDDEKPLKIKAAIWLKFVSKWSAFKHFYHLIIQNRLVRKCYIDIISQVMHDDPKGMGRLSQIGLLSVSHVHIRDQNSHHSQHDFMANNYVWNPKANN